MEATPDKPFIGVIKVYYPLKGYGFITRKAGKDVFFYRDAIANEATIIEGSAVHFGIENTGKGPKAVDVVRVG